MDLVRNIISNLYIYKNQNNDNLDMNNFAIKSLPNNKNNKSNELILNNIQNNNLSLTYNNEEKPIIENNQNKNNNNNLYDNSIENKNENNNNIRKNNSLNRLDNYNLKYISLKNNNFLKNEVNYVLKNKELIKEKENQIKEIKQKKESEALNLLLSFKTRKTEGVRTRVYDYEIKQKEKNKSLIKNNKFKIRNLSSQKQIRNKITINHENKNQNQYMGTINQEDNNKIKIGFTKSLKLPQIKPSTSEGLQIPLLHKDYGKMPEYLEKRKKEIQEQKELEIKKEKEKKIPSGWKILSDEEKQRRLADLNNEKKKLDEKLYKLPIARLSRQQEDLKRNIEKSLNEIDEKINKLVGYKEVIIREDE